MAEITLLEYWRALKKRGKLFLAIVLLLQVTAGTYIIFAPRTYKSEATLLPIGGQNNSPMASFLANSALGSMINAAQSASTIGALTAILESRTMSRYVVEKLDLRKVYFSEFWSPAENAWTVTEHEIPPIEAVVLELQKDMNFEVDANLVTLGIEAEAPTAQLAANIVNAYIEGLGNYLVKNALTSAKRNRIFIEEQLEHNKRSVLETGKEITLFYENNKISGRNPRLDVEILIQERVASEKASDVTYEVSQLNNQRASIEKNIQSANLVKDVPQQIYLEYISDYYALLKKINTLLTEQYEMAKLNEAREDINFAVIDPGEVPLSKYKPFTIVILILSFTFSFFLFAFIAFFLEHLNKLRRAEANT